MNRSSRLPLVALLILSLVLAGFARQWADRERNFGTYLSSGGSHYGTSATGLSRMNSFALALLLGGLRGPLVMFLWPSTEQQKIEKNLEDFDTKIEWIRLLQAEFDTVHLFQIWNKAYNISVQMANLGNKYRAILDALDYAHSVDAERPNDINILSAIGQVYLDKLGNSNEKTYYRERIREESMARLDMVRITLPVSRQAQFTEIALDAGIAPDRLQFSEDEKARAVSITLNKPAADLIRQRLDGSDIQYATRPRAHWDRSDPGWHRTELDPILDMDGNILPEYLAVRSPRPANLSADSEWNDGSELQYLKPYQPFSYGVSPLALAYNYYKRSQVLQSVNYQRHAQLSPLVVDSRPALALKFWSEEEWEYGRRAELDAFGIAIPSERIDMELLTANVSPDAKIAHRKFVDEAIFDYARSAQVAGDAEKEYKRHLKNFNASITNYLSHLDDLYSHRALVEGDRDFLQAMIDPANRAKLLTSAAEHYRQSRQRTELTVLSYYVLDEMAQKLYPPGITRANIARSNLSAAQIHDLAQRVRAVIEPEMKSYVYREDLGDYLKYLDHAQGRLKAMGQN